MRGIWVLVVLLSLATLACVPSAAQAGGVLTVGVQGQGDVAGPGVSCSHEGGDCGQLVIDDRYCPQQPIPLPDMPAPVEEERCVNIPNSISVTAVDRAGTGFGFSGWDGCDSVSGPTCHVFMTDSRNVTVRFADRQGPGVSLLEPAPDATRRGLLNLRATASDNVGISRIEYLVNGRPAGSAAPNADVTFNSAEVADGPVEVRAVAFDTSNNSTVQTRVVMVDNTPPPLAVAGADGGKFPLNTTLRWRIDTADSTEIASVECSLEPKGSSASFEACNGGTRSHSATLRAVGEYVFMVRVTDDAGNVTTSRRMQFAIDPDAGRSGGSTTGGSGSDGSGMAAFRPLVRNSFRTRRSWTQFLRLSVSNLPAGSRVEVSCRGGRGCPFERRKFGARRGKVSLVKALKGRRLAAGTRLTVRAIGPGGEQKVVTFTMRRGKAPRQTVRCAAAGGRLGRCG
jgi:hypothetical protein